MKKRGTTPASHTLSGPALSTEGAPGARELLQSPRISAPRARGAALPASSRARAGRRIARIAIAGALIIAMLELQRELSLRSGIGDECPGRAGTSTSVPFAIPVVRFTFRTADILPNTYGTVDLSERGLRHPRRYDPGGTRVPVALSLLACWPAWPAAAQTGPEIEKKSEGGWAGPRAVWGAATRRRRRGRWRQHRRSRSRSRMARRCL